MFIAYRVAWISWHLWSFGVGQSSKSKISYTVYNCPFLILLAETVVPHGCSTHQEDPIRSFDQKRTPWLQLQRKWAKNRSTFFVIWPEVHPVLVTSTYFGTGKMKPYNDEVAALAGQCDFHWISRIWPSAGHWAYRRGPEERGSSLVKNASFPNTCFFFKDIFQK